MSFHYPVNKFKLKLMWLSRPLFKNMSWKQKNSFVNTLQRSKCKRLTFFAHVSSKLSGCNKFSQATPYTPPCSGTYRPHIRQTEYKPMKRKERKSRSSTTAIHVKGARWTAIIAIKFGAILHRFDLGESVTKINVYVRA